MAFCLGGWIYVVFEGQEQVHELDELLDRVRSVRVDGDGKLVRGEWQELDGGDESD